MKPLTALVIGFGPFPGAPVNPSAALVRAIGQARRPAFSGARIVTHVLPTSYAAVREELPELIRTHQADIVLMFGLAGRARTLRVETLAVNASSMLHPDQTGAKPAMRKLIPSSTGSLKANVPVAAMIAAAKSAGVNANVSRNAGRYICNAALFTCLDLKRTTRTPRIVAFVHIPPPRKPLHRGKRANRKLPASRMLERAGAAILGALLAATKRV